MKVDDREWERFKRFCQREFDYITKTLKSDYWHFTLNFVAQPHNSIFPSDSADSETDYEYREHNITIYRKLFDSCWNNNLENIRLLLVHEYCHLYFSPICEQVMDGAKNNAYLDKLEERTTEMVAINYYNYLYGEKKPSIHR